jgi:hypothetical protein
MKLGHNQLQGTDSLGWMYIYGDSPAIVFYPDYIVSFQHYKYRIAVALHGLVHGVIHYFIYKMMKAVDAGSANIHTRPLSYCFKAFKNLDILSGIV